MTFWGSKRGEEELCSSSVLQVTIPLNGMFNDNIGYSFVSNIFDIEKMASIFSSTRT